jgi:hypothetical protein
MEFLKILRLRRILYKLYWFGVDISERNLNESRWWNL